MLIKIFFIFLKLPFSNLLECKAERIVEHMENAKGYENNLLRNYKAKGKMQFSWRT